MKRLKLKKQEYWQFQLAFKIITIITLLFYVAYLICDMIFISKGLTLEGEFLDWRLEFDQYWFNVSVGMCITLLVLYSIILMFNLIHLIGASFNFKKNKPEQLYKIIVDGCIIAFLLTVICATPSYIYNDQYVFDVNNFDSLSHMDILNYISCAFVVCFVSLLMHHKKDEVFSLNTMEKDFKWIVRAFGIAAIFFIPLFIWKVLPVHFFNDDLTQNWSNIIAEVITIPFQMLTIIQAIILFGLGTIYAYKHIKLKSNHTIGLTLSAIFFFLITLFFVINHANKLDINKFIDYEQVKDNWKTIFSFNFVQVMIGLAASITFMFSFKPKQSEKISKIYVDENIN